MNQYLFFLIFSFSFISPLVGIEAVLSQIQDGKERVIVHLSKSVTRKELWAVVYHVKHFRCYLYGRHFTIRTDHGSLKWLHRFKEAEGQLARWLDILAEYDYTIICRPGVQHRNADGLSRRHVMVKVVFVPHFRVKSKYR